MSSYLLLAYLLSAVCFIVALKQLGHPRTALGGNAIGAAGMLVAIVVTVVASGRLPTPLVIAGLLIGAVVGLLCAVRIQFTAMPQLVALFNGFGGVSSALVAGVVLYYLQGNAAHATSILTRVAAIASGVIGAVTLTGSVVAFAKLQGIFSEKPLVFSGHQLLKIAITIACAFSVYLAWNNPASAAHYWIMSAVAGVLGLALVLSIGGADMPVVIALLNSYSGLAAAATGFALGNNLLVVAGTLVGASGIILTRIMCRAMNRSLANVLLGGVGAVTTTAQESDDFYTGKYKSTSPEEALLLLKNARKVVIVPGYGMAVAQAQSAVRALTERLEGENIDVSFAIHPVAGRMPGHMNVLLAEERIPYQKMVELEKINPEFPSVDVVIVIGANDVVNPLAREESGNPISGMPILNVDHAHAVIVIKRSLSPGFAGLPNPLFIRENTLMLFGDGRQVVEEMVSVFKDV